MRDRFRNVGFFSLQSALVFTSIFFVNISIASTSTSITRKLSESNLQVDLNSSIQFKSIRSTNDYSDFSNFRLNPEFQLQTSPKMSFKLSADLNFNSGFQQSIFDSNIEKNGFQLREASLNWAALSKLTLSAGALNTGSLKSPLLVSNSTTFTGLKERYQFNSIANWQFSFMAHQLIPTSESLSKQNSQIEPTPYFFTESLQASADINSRLKVTSALHLFEYTNLPQSVALKSRLYGNSVPNSTDQFSYTFKGYAFNLASSILLNGRHSLQLGYSFLQNQSAPSERNQGQLISAQYTWSKKTDLIIVPKIEYFINQSDSSPAYYNDSFYGHNNRKGLAYSATFHLKSSNLKIVTNFVDTKAIQADSLEPNQKLFLINLETNYEIM